MTSTDSEVIPPVPRGLHEEATAAPPEAAAPSHPLLGPSYDAACASALSGTLVPGSIMSPSPHDLNRLVGAIDWVRDSDHSFLRQLMSVPSDLALAALIFQFQLDEGIFETRLAALPPGALNKLAVRIGASLSAKPNAPLCLLAIRREVERHSTKMGSLVGVIASFRRRAGSVSVGV